MGPVDEFVISVIAEWNDWRSADARLGDLRDIHWHQPKGAPHVLIHAYIWCDVLTSSDLSHTCDHVSAPHRLRVCVLRSRNLPSAYDELVRRAAQTSRLGSTRAALLTCRAVSAGTVAR